jgi:hypothetical protein
MSVHELQAKAFLVASEDVDIDQEIIEDILKGLDRDIAAVNGQVTEEEDEDGSSLADDDFEGELDISALFANAPDGETILIMSNDSTTHLFRCIPTR